MTENVLSLGKLCTELLSVVDEPGLCGTSLAIKCRKVLGYSHSALIILRARLDDVPHNQRRCH